MTKVELLRGILDEDIFEYWYYTDGDRLTIEEIINLQLIKTLKEFINNKREYVTGPR